jgi:polar amino acid transport system permease protein
LELVSTFLDAWPQLWSGIRITLTLAFGGGILAFLVAVVLGLMSITRFAVLKVISRIVVEFFRGTSLVVQLFVLYYVFPQFGLALQPIAAGIVALGLNYGAYGAEVVRGSMNAVPKGQWEVTTALSMPWLLKVRRVIWPQAWALMLPGFNNLQVMLVKGTAVAFLIGLYDLTFRVNQLRKDEGTWVAFGFAFLLYYLIALGFSAFLRLLERRAQRKLGMAPSKAETTHATAEAVA